MWEKLAPLHIGHGTCAVAAKLLSVVSYGRCHSSRTDSRRIFKLGEGVDQSPHDPPCMSTDQGQKVKVT